MESGSNTTTATRNKRTNRSGIEENILAILDSPGSKDTPDANDDRFAFLEAVRAAFVLPELGTPPTSKMYEEVFRIMRVGNSLELIVESYWLLIELDKRFPRVSVLKSSELIVDNEDWSPLILGCDYISSGRVADDTSSSGPLDSSGFHLLIEDLAGITNETNFQATGIKSFRSMLLFQYLVNFLGRDFLPRNRVYKETMNWSVLRESVLTMLLGSRRISYKTLMKDCLSVLCGIRQVSTGIFAKSSDECPAKSCENCHNATLIALLDAVYSICTAMQKFLIMIMDLDVSRMLADQQGSITRADGVRTPLIEIILDELTYDRDMLSPFLLVFNDPKWKLEIIEHYFSKYTSKPSVRTRRSNGSAEDATFSGMLRFLCNPTNTRNITKKISSEVVQILLAHAFQAHLSLASSQQDAEDFSKPEDEKKSTNLVEICKSMISAFGCLRQTDPKMKILPIGKEALITTTILSTRLNQNLDEVITNVTRVNYYRHVHRPDKMEL